jgi:flavin reductase (DIM6/NTAB) family NADH-FMN oxidoreductase RutF
MPTPATTDLALALGRVPTGLFIVTTRHEGAPLGFVGSFVTQVAFVPPTISVAIGKERAHLPAIRASGKFGVSVLDDASLGLMSTFFKRFPAGESPFDELRCSEAPGGSPVLDDALAWLECQVRGEYDAGDHVVVFGEVTGGRVLRAGEPLQHVRRSGLGY